MDSLQSPLRASGVVFNEMTGDISSVGGERHYQLHKHLLPDTCYKYRAGGTLEAMLDLTYGQLQVKVGRED